MEPTPSQIKAMRAISASNRKALISIFGEQHLPTLTNVLYRHILGMDAPTYRQVYKIGRQSNVRQHLLNNKRTFEYQMILCAEREISAKISSMESVSFLDAWKIFDDVGQSLSLLVRAA